MSKIVKIFKKIKEESLTLSKNILNNQNNQKKEGAKNRNLNFALKINDKNKKSDSYFKDLINFGVKKLTCEDTLEFKTILEDGICFLGNNEYSKMLKFEDINYSLESEEKQLEIFSNYVKLFNSMDTSVSFELFFLNRKQDQKKYNNQINILDRDDNLNDLRQEFRNMLKNQSQKGNNGIEKTKYIIFKVFDKEFKSAKLKLERICLDVKNHFKNMAVDVSEVLGEERVELLQNILDSKTDEKINFKSLNSIKSLVCPQKINFINKDYFKINNKFANVSSFIIQANELSDDVLTEILKINANLCISIHIEIIDQNVALKLVKRKLSDVQKLVIEEQKKALRNGYDMDILPGTLSFHQNAMKDLLEDLQSRDERLFNVNINIMNIADTLDELEGNLKKISMIANKNTCSLLSLSYMQEQYFLSTLGLGYDKALVKRYLTSTSVAVFIPFLTKELFTKSNESFYYGLNQLSNNLIMGDRNLLRCPNGLILGTPGSGKSFAAKREMVNAILVTKDDVIICDPEGEYGELVKSFNGEVIKLSASSKTYLNPFDINMNYGDGDDPLKDKANFIMNLFELVVGNEGLQAIEKSIIDRCLPIIYEKYFKTLEQKDLPILEDLYKILKQQGKIGEKLSQEMEIYVTGSLNVFNHHTNLDLNKRLLCFDIKELGTQLKKIGMFILQDQVWNKVSSNRNQKRKTLYYIDEFHLLLKDKQTSLYSVEIWKRFRKWGGIPTGITQNVKDFLSSPEISNIFDNTDFILILNQKGDDRSILAKKLQISPLQLSYITNSPQGSGLIVFGSVIIPFVDKFPKNTNLYKMMTTKLDEKGKKE